MRRITKRSRLVLTGAGVGLAALVVITSSVVRNDAGAAGTAGTAGATRPSGGSAPPQASSSATPSGTAATRSQFGTLPPGSRLPSDEECASGVAPAVETRAENTPFNKTRGGQRLPSDFFTPGSGDPRSNSEIASRVSGAYTGTTRQVLQWAACKWGIDERYVRAQAAVESSWRQPRLSDWTDDPGGCAPGHGLGADGRAGQCPESFGILQVRYQYYSGAFPSAITSTAFNVDAAYAVWRACFEGYETWLGETAPAGHPYQAGDAWGCIGRWFSGQWYDSAAVDYITSVRAYVCPAGSAADLCGSATRGPGAPFHRG
jgi:hypothetical protein